VRVRVRVRVRVTSQWFREEKKVSVTEPYRVSVT
jgi:hypothetical protein